MNLNEIGVKVDTFIDINTTSTMIRNLPPIGAAGSDYCITQSPEALQHGNVTAADVPLTMEDLCVDPDMMD